MVRRLGVGDLLKTLNRLILFVNKKFNKKRLSWNEDFSFVASNIDLIGDWNILVQIKWLLT